MRDEVKYGGRRVGNEGTGRDHSLPDDDGQRTADDVPCVTFWTRAIRRNFGSTVSTAKRARRVDPATHHEKSVKLQHPPRTDARSQSSPSQPFLLFTPLPPSCFNLHITYHLNTDYY